MDAVKPRVLCSLPWTQCEVSGDGIRPCCFARYAPPQRQEIQYWMDAANFRQLRDKLLAGERPQECRACNGGMGGVPRASERVEVPEARDFSAGFAPPRIMVRFAIECNCRCVMCAIWGVQREGRGPWPIKPVSPLFLESIRREAAQISNISMTGGEPFIIPSCLQFLQEFTGISSPGPTFSVSTNGTRVPFDVVAELRWKTIQVSCSAGRPETYEWAHAGASWEGLLKTLKTLSQMKTARRNIRNLVTNFAVFSWNWKEVPRAAERDRQLGIASEFRRGVAPTNRKDWALEAMDGDQRRECLALLKGTAHPGAAALAAWLERQPQAPSA